MKKPKDTGGSPKKPKDTGGSPKKLGRCYEVHATALTNAALRQQPIVPGATDEYLCHGDVWGETHGFHGHCWIEFRKDGITWVQDLTADAILPRDLYYQWGKIRKVKRYTMEQAGIKLLKTGHYGPWED